MTDYEIRPFKPGDRDGFLDLYQEVLGGRKGDEWFDWKYDNNPFVGFVPMYVTEHEGEIVGARPFFALSMAIGETRTLTLHAGDLMVHPDHRRRGLFTSMTEKAVDEFADSCPIVFTFPNERALSGYRKFGWTVVSERTCWFRIQNPRQIVRAKEGRTPVGLAAEIGTPFLKAHHRIKQRNRDVDSELSVRKEEDIPTGELSALYRSSVPTEIHAIRDDTFYDWRFKNPDWDYTTYIAEERGEPVTGIVTGTDNTDARITKLTEVVPLGGHEDSLQVLFERIISDHETTDMFIAPSQGIPKSVLRNFGFLPDNGPPISFFASPTTHVVRVLDDEEKMSEIGVKDPENWKMTFVEEDTS